MPFSLAENLPFLALPVALITLKVTYDMLPPVAFLALVAALIGAYMFYAGNKSPAAQRTAKRAEATADNLIRELTEEEDRVKQEAVRKQAIKDKKAAAKQKQEAARKASVAAKEAKEAAAAAVIAKQEADKQRSTPAPPSGSKAKKQPKQAKKQPKVVEPEEEDSDDDDDFLQRMAKLEQQRRDNPLRK